MLPRAVVRSACQVREVRIEAFDSQPGSLVDRARKCVAALPDGEGLPGVSRLARARQRSHPKHWLRAEFEGSARETDRSVGDEFAVGAGSAVRSAITPLLVVSVSGERQRAVAGIDDLLACSLWSPRVCQFRYRPHRATGRFQVIRSAEKVSTCDATRESTPAPEVCY